MKLPPNNSLHLTVRQYFSQDTSSRRRLDVVRGWQVNSGVRFLV
jgi:hypothetical protein